MARIVSGWNQEGPDFGAVLKGYEYAHKQRLADEDAQREQAALMFKIHEAMLEHKKEEAKTQALLNEKAQMGDAQALQQLSMRMQAGAHPGAAIIKDAMGTLSRIDDPKARAVAAQAFKSGLAEVHKRGQQKAALAAVQRAATNGLIEPDEYVKRLQSGEEPETITKELATMEGKRNAETRAMEGAQESIAHMEQLLKSAPRGRAREEASAILTHFKNSPHDQSQPDSGPKTLEEFQKALIGTAGEYKARQKAKEEKMRTVLSGPLPGLGGMMPSQFKEELGKQPTQFDPFGVTGGKGGFHGGPDIPPLGQEVGTHRTKKEHPEAFAQATQPAKAEAQPSAPDGNESMSEAIKGAKSVSDIRELFQKRGIPLTPQNAALAANLWRRRGQ